MSNVLAERLAAAALPGGRTPPTQASSRGPSAAVIGDCMSALATPASADYRRRCRAADITESAPEAHGRAQVCTVCDRARTLTDRAGRAMASRAFVSRLPVDACPHFTRPSATPARPLVPTGKSPSDADGRSLPHRGRPERATTAPTVLPLARRCGPLGRRAAVQGGRGAATGHRRALASRAALACGARMHLTQPPARCRHERRDAP